MRPLQGASPVDLEPIQRLLNALAGPMRFDVCVREIRRIDVPVSNGIHLFVPEMHLPLVPKLPDVDASLVPDPNQATCTCHGPVITRMLYGASDAPARYRVVAAPLSRNPNDWFYWLAEVHRAIADDLIKFLDRLAKHAGQEPVHVVQLGGLVEVWQGYRCVVQTLGWAAFVKPTVIDDAAPAQLLEAWSGKTIGTKSRDAVERFVLWQRRGAVLLHASELGFLARTGAFVAEVRSSVVEREAPSAFLALREQKVRLIPPNIQCLPEFLLPYLAEVHERTMALGAGLYVTAGAPKAFLSTMNMFA